MKKKMMKALRDLNAYIDDDRQKLCDRLHDLELSHKRMETLLRRFDRLFSSDFFFQEDLLHLIDDVKRELSYPYYRVNYKVKGNKNG